MKKYNILITDKDLISLEVLHQVLLNQRPEITIYDDRYKKDKIIQDQQVTDSLVAFVERMLKQTK